MKQSIDKFIINVSEKPHRGRFRPTPAKSAVQRQREFRRRQKFNFLLSVMRDEK